MAFARDKRRVILPVSVIIPSRNRALLLADTLRSILDGDALPSEIVVVDQSHEATVMRPPRRIPGCAIRTVHMTETGVSRARNHGARVASHNILVFTDDDVYASRGWLLTLVDALNQGQHDVVVTGSVLPGVAERPGGFVPATVFRTTAARYRGRLERDVLAGGNMAIRRDYFHSLGGFEVCLGAGSEFPSAEDNDLGFRVLETGGSVHFVPDAMLVHRAWRHSSAYVPLRYAYGRGKGGFYVKHLSARDLHMAQRMARDLLTRLFRAARYCCNPRRAIGELAYAAGVISGSLRWAVTRRGLRQTMFDRRRDAQSTHLVYAGRVAGSRGLLVQAAGPEVRASEGRRVLRPFE